MTSTAPDPSAVARQLGELLGTVDRGEIEATDVERAYLAGARDALAAVTRPVHP